MADEQRILSVKISAIRDTLVKLGKSIKTGSRYEDDVAEFAGFSPEKRLEIPLTAHQRSRALTDTDGKTMYEGGGFQAEKSLIETRSRGNSLQSFSCDRTYHSPETPQTQLVSRDKRDQVDTLLQRISDKDQLLRDQSTHIVRMEEQIDCLRAALAQARSDYQREVGQLEEELDREKRLRIQAEMQLKNAVLSEETKIQRKLKASFSANEEAWKSDLESLQRKLEEVNRAKVGLLAENAELQRHLQHKEFELLKSKEEARTASEQRRGETEREFGQTQELRMVQKEVARLRKENDELRQTQANPSPHLPSPSDLAPFHAKIADLEAQISKLNSEHENLCLELSSRPTYKQLREKELQITDLREENTRKRNLTPLQSPKNPSKPSENPKFDLNQLKPTQKTDDSKERQKLVTRLEGLVQACSPRDGNKRPPSCKEIWAWTKHLAEDYMRVKKAEESRRAQGELVAEMMKMLGLAHPSDLPKALSHTLAENSAIAPLSNHIKSQLKLSPSTSLPTLLQLLSASHH